jgi:hypothetical protein
MSSNKAQKQAQNMIAKMSDKELTRFRTNVEIECANRELPNTIDATIEKMDDKQVVVLFMSLYNALRERGVIPDSKFEHVSDGVND